MKTLTKDTFFVCIGRVCSMKKKNKSLILIGFASLSLVLASCGEEPKSSIIDTNDSSIDTSEDSDDEPVNPTDNQIKLLSPSPSEEIQITPTPLMNYINAKTEQEQIAALKVADTERSNNLTCTSVKLSWQKDGSAYYTISLSTAEDFANAKEIKVSSLFSEQEIYNLIPNTTYYWKVKGTRSNDTSEVSSFKTLGTSIRFIKASGAANIRDLGGYQTKEGNHIQYGKIYRGGLLNNFNNLGGLDENGIKTFNEDLGIQTEIDLRITGMDDGNQSKCFFDSNKNYVQATIGQYNRILDPESFAKSNGFDSYKLLIGKDGSGMAPNYELAASVSGVSVKSLRTIFDVLSKEENYPVYFHCNAGADRTGTLSYLIEGLLGVSYEDIVKDFELTSFSKFGNRYRSALSEDGLSFDDSGVFMDKAGENYVGFSKLNEDMLNYYGEEGKDLSFAIYSYLTKYVGIPSSTIEKVKSILTSTAEANSYAISNRQEFALSQDNISIDLSSANIDENSIASIEIANIDLGTNPNEISLSAIKEAGLSGEREIVVKAKKEGQDITIYVPILLVSKYISSVEEFYDLDTYRKKIDNGSDRARVINFGYYKLTSDIGSESSPLLSYKIGGYIHDQLDSNGNIGFRGTIDGGNNSVYSQAAYGGLFSVIGGGAVIKNTNFVITSYASASGDASVVGALGCTIAGAIIENVNFTVTSSCYGNSDSQLYGSGVGLICTSACRSTIFKNVSVTSPVKLVSLFGGLSYDGFAGCQFECFNIDCQELSYLAVKAGMGTINQSKCVLPIELNGIKGSYQTYDKDITPIDLNSKFASISLGNLYGSMNLIDVYYKDNKIEDAILENNILFFNIKTNFQDGVSRNGQLKINLEKDGLACSHSINIQLIK
ncbi:MAG TPA: hypothetical protein DEF61_04840 [Firmicutes bacterium]|nr:hypothetical protein [Bacillota bacterium]HBX25554.1 hypothetical protein [Bacillota bacterium]